MLNTNTLFMTANNITSDTLYESIVEMSILDLVKTGKPQLLQSLCEENYDMFLETMASQAELEDSPKPDPDSVLAWSRDPDVNNPRHAYHYRTAKANSVYDPMSTKQYQWGMAKVLKSQEFNKGLEELGIDPNKNPAGSFTQQIKFWLNQKRDAIAKYIDALNSWLRKFIKKYNNTPKEKRGFFRTIIHYITSAIEILTRKLHNSIQVNRGNIQDDIMAPDERVKDLSVLSPNIGAAFVDAYKGIWKDFDKAEEMRRKELNGEKVDPNE